MSYLPKKAQRKIAAACRPRTDIQAVMKSIVDRDKPPPRYLNIDIHPRALCQAVKVFLNDVQQTVCTTADVDKGYIIRYLAGHYGLKRPTERLEGTVRIEWR